MQKVSRNDQTCPILEELHIPQVPELNIAAVLFITYSLEFNFYMIH